MQSSNRMMLVGGGLLVITSVIAVLGYMILAQASLLEAIYMVAITIFSVGYEESVHVEGPALKVFTIVVIVAGCSSLLYASGGFVQMIAEGGIARAMNERRNASKIDALESHAIVCGYGRMGQILAKELADAKHPFVIIDTNEERARQAEELGFLVVRGDAADEETLKLAHIETAKSLATVLPVDAANVFIALSARSMNPKLRILARGEIPSTESKLRKAGADQVVLPAAIGGLRLAQMIVRPSAQLLIDMLDNLAMVNHELETLGVRLSDIVVPEGSPFARKTVGELEIEGDGAYLIVAIHRVDGRVVQNPTANDVVYGGDTVIVIGHGKMRPRFTLEESSAREIVLRPDEA